MRSPVSQYKWLSKKKHTSVGVWSIKGRKLRIILLNILFHKNINITSLSTYNVLPLYWTLSMLFPIVIITWIILSLFYRRGNWGSERLNDLPKVTHFKWQNWNSNEVFLTPKSELTNTLRFRSVLTKGWSPAMWHDTQHEMTSFNETEETTIEYVTSRTDS